MSYPDTVKIVDLMMGIPVSETNQEWYDSFMPMLKDKESIDQFKMPAQYMFRDVPLLEKTDDYVTFLVGEMDKYNIDIAMVGYFEGSEAAAAAKKVAAPLTISATPKAKDLIAPAALTAVFLIVAPVLANNASVEDPNAVT